MDVGSTVSSTEARKGREHVCMFLQGSGTPIEGEIKPSMKTDLQFFCENQQQAQCMREGR